MVEQAADIPKEIQSSFQVIEFSSIAVTDWENQRSQSGVHQIYESQNINLYEVARNQVVQTCNTSSDNIRQILGLGYVVVLVAGLSTGQSAVRTSLGLVHFSACCAFHGREGRVTVTEITRHLLFSLIVSFLGQTFPKYQNTLPCNTILIKTCSVEQQSTKNRFCFVIFLYVHEEGMLKLSNLLVLIQSLPLLILL